VFEGNPPRSKPHSKRAADTACCGSFEVDCRCSASRETSCGNVLQQHLCVSRSDELFAWPHITLLHQLRCLWQERLRSITRCTLLTKLATALRHLFYSSPSAAAECLLLPRSERRHAQSVTWHIHAAAHGQSQQSLCTRIGKCWKDGSGAKEWRTL